MFIYYQQHFIVLFAHCLVCSGTKRGGCTQGTKPKHWQKYRNLVWHTKWILIWCTESVGKNLIRIQSSWSQGINDGLVWAELKYLEQKSLRESPISLAGCGIWLFLAVTFGIWAENRAGKRKLQLEGGAGFCVFIGLGCGIRREQGPGSRKTR